MIKFGCKKNTLKLDRVGSRLNIKVNKKLSVFSGRGSTTSRHIRLPRTSKHKTLNFCSPSERKLNVQK